MRENMGLYRGKRTKDGVWSEGPLLFVEDKPAIYDQNDTDISAVWDYGEARLWGCYEVDPDTVGQYTGRTDKNGKKIFEGDIVRYVNPDEDAVTGRVSYGEHSYSGTHEIGFYVAWQKPEWAMYLRDDLGFWTNFREIEVIGNIHDNPDLIEVNKNA